MQPVQMHYQNLTLSPYPFTLNLIDTPGHVDFSYEVSRAMNAVEGAILLVDAQKGIQAQTLSNLEQAQKQGLKIIPAINKIDLPQARTALVKEELATLLKIEPSEVLEVSAKANQGVGELLETVIKLVPPPKKFHSQTSSALVFDSFYDSYKGVVVHVRIFGGKFKKGDLIRLLRQNIKTEVIEVGIFTPEPKAEPGLEAGLIGYIATGLKEPGLVKVGETIVLERDFETGLAQPLPGYEEPKPVVFASFYPKETSDFEALKLALGKLKLNDAALFYELESSSVLGRGFKVGFLGLLHLEIVLERLKREFKLELVVTAPSVAYEVTKQAGIKHLIYSPNQLPGEYQAIREPWVQIEILTPPNYVGVITQLIERSRGIMGETKSLGPDRLLIVAQAPLSEILVDFFDKLKSATAGFASMNYTLAGFKEADLVRLDILINRQRVDGLSQIVPRDSVYQEGKRIVAKLKEILQPEQFAVTLQAASGSRIMVRETIKARRKDVTGYLYGGDRTRKMKLWQKQKRGKKKLQETGRVSIPPSTFLELLKKR